jgi:hypothetical protein
MPITTKVMSLNPDHGEVHSMQYYVIKFVSDLRQVSCFLRVLRFPPPIRQIATIYLKYCTVSSDPIFLYFQDFAIFPIFS